jgi:hypothetical protein
MTIKIVSVSIPEYTIKEKPDYLKIGKKVDTVIEKNFNDRKYVYRAIGIDDHPGLTLDELVSVILKSGTDMYDRERKGVCYEQFSVYDYDIQAGSFEIKNHKIIIEETDTYPTLFGDTIHDFYENAPLDRGYPVRIDILILYDSTKLELAKLINDKMTRVTPNLEKYLYKFKNRKNKKGALLGIIKILR